MSKHVDPSNGSLRLRDMLNKQTVKAKVNASTWEEAADRVGELLVAAGHVKPSYVEAMKRLVREVGPYIVIVPGIALLHARPEDGVLAPCFALITLARPVAFGHSQNDPVDIVFAFGAVDKQAHMAALQEIAGLLMDDTLLERLRAAPDDRSLIAVVNGDRA